MKWSLFNFEVFFLCQWTKCKSRIKSSFGGRCFTAASCLWKTNSCRRLQCCFLLCFQPSSSWGRIQLLKFFARFLCTPLEIIIIQKKIYRLPTAKNKTKQKKQLKSQLKVKENYVDSSFKAALALYHSPSNEVTPTAQKLKSDLSHNVEKIRWNGGVTNWPESLDRVD